MDIKQRILLFFLYYGKTLLLFFIWWVSLSILVVLFSEERPHNIYKIVSITFIITLILFGAGGMFRRDPVEVHTDSGIPPYKSILNQQLLLPPGRIPNTREDPCVSATEQDDTDKKWQNCDIDST